MYRPHIRGRRRILNPALKSELCRLVAESATIEQAADTLDVSLRTVQRERKNDEDFDHELRLSLQAEPNPKKLMQTAARTHWRAAAWLLERTDPETYARRPVNTANPKQVEAALCFLLEAALQATPEEKRPAFFESVNAAREQAFDCVFPNLGPWGNPRAPKCPPSPLTDYLITQAHLANARVIPDRDEAGNVLPSPLLPAPLTFAEAQAAAAARAAERDCREAKLREYREGLRCASDPSEYFDPIEEVDDPDHQGILSPKIGVATKCKSDPNRGTLKSPRAGRFSDQSTSGPSADPTETVPKDAHAELVKLDEQLRQAVKRRRESLLSRRTRAATKRRKTRNERARRNQLAH